MKTLILGASGYLGGVLLQKMKQRAEIETAGTCFRNTGDTSLLTIDVTDRDQLEQLWATQKPDIVIWAMMSNLDEGKLIHKGLRNLLKIISPDTRLIYVSTDGFFPGDRGGYTEDDPVTYMETGHALAAYCNAKLDGEKLIAEHHSHHVVVRTGPIYGKDAKGAWDKRTAALIAKLEAAETVVRSGNVYRTFTHVEDLAEALAELVLHEYRGILHVGPLQKESYFTFAQTMAQQLKLPAELIEENTVGMEEAQRNGIILDCSLNTAKAEKLLQTKFRSLRGENHGQIITRSHKLDQYD